MSNFDIQNRDCLEWLSCLQAGSADLIVTDPAYESLEKHRKIGTTTRLKQSAGSSNEWFPIFPNSNFPEFFRLCYTALGKDRHFYMFCDQETAFLTKPMAEAVGFKWWKALIWDKVAPGMGYHYRCRHEFIMFYEKGKRRLDNNSVPDVLQFKRVVNGYPTEKPVDLIQTLILNSCPGGGLVIDPFTGSGAVGEAALRSGCHFYGCDIKPNAVELATARLIKVQQESA
jgi:site-specific DNA-methyltransferase (adenine-specific)